MQARKAYRTFVADGIPLGRRPEFQGGGLVRSLGGWHAVAVLCRVRWERVLTVGETEKNIRKQRPL